jgi:hypothetical protein
MHSAESPGKLTNIAWYDSRHSYLRVEFPLRLLPIPGTADRVCAMDLGMGALRRLLKKEESRATCEGYDPHMWALVFDGPFQL